MRPAEHFCPHVSVDQSLVKAQARAQRWKMAGRLEALKVDPLGAGDEAEEAEGSLLCWRSAHPWLKPRSVCETHWDFLPSLSFPHSPLTLTGSGNSGFLSTGQAKSLEKTEDLLTMVEKLQKEGSLEPQIEDLIHRISELQQAKKKASEELGEAQALYESLHRELDSLNGEKVHLEEVLSKKQETLKILQLHCQEKESEAQRLDFEEQLEKLMGQHKDLWKFQMLEQRLAREIRTLEISKGQLLVEERLARTKLEEVERRLRSPLGFEGPQVVSDGLDLRCPEAAAAGPAQCSPRASKEKDLEPPVELA
ncbi:synaptonemal complex central element protein 1-like [Choloepus didactylus]|uniref:synaptonemal complex central element protein 1-like n=1 Tax=Choloepus didactylus TaxID=27675 RepID=UPI00189DC6AC|nr:synaptonemal complex central element protein 1-like [Choloepus didactylus]